MELSDEDTQNFYGRHSWPGPKAIVSRKWAARFGDLLNSDTPIRLLEAGCGSGQDIVGMLSEFPEMTGVGVDLSKLSIEHAENLSSRQNVSDRVAFHSLSFSDPLPWRDEFDVVISHGAIHHSPDPAKSMANISAALKPGGLFGAMIYGERSQQRRYEIKEALSIMGATEIDHAFELYNSYQGKYNSILDKTLRTLIRDLRRSVGRFRQKMLGKEEYLGYDENKFKRDIFVDGYFTPIDRAYNSRQIHEMMDGAGLELIEMLSAGKPEEDLLP
jgi:SAM-dependent methyltransferase